MAHRIRLGTPWDSTATDDGRARHVRRFGRPRTLDANERVWLVAESLPAESNAAVNGTAVESELAGSFAADITSLLKPRNEVAFTLPAKASLGEVALEIRG